MSWEMAIPLAMNLIGGIAGAKGNIAEGEARAAQLRDRQKIAYYQAQVARNNKIIAEQNATREEQAGGAMATDQSMLGAAKLARIKAGQAAHGVDVNTGSAVDVQAGQRNVNQLDTERVMSNAELRAYGYRAQAVNFDAQANLDTMTGDQYGTASSDALAAGYMKAGGSILGTASQLPWKWLGGLGGGGSGVTSTQVGGPDGFGGIPA